MFSNASAKQAHHADKILKYREFWPKSLILPYGYLIVTVTAGFDLKMYSYIGRRRIYTTRGIIVNSDFKEDNDLPWLNQEMIALYTKRGKWL